MTKRKPPDQLMKEGRKSTYREENVRLAQKLAHLGATDRDLADAFGVSIRTISIWQAKHPEFMQALKLGKKEADSRVERSLYQKAVGYNYDAVKIFMPAGAKTIYAPHVEHVHLISRRRFFGLRTAWQLEVCVRRTAAADQGQGPAKFARG